MGLVFGQCFTKKHLIIHHHDVFACFGEHGTANWATLFEDYCAGSKQSPIDIDTSALVKKDFDPLVLKGYKRKVPGYWENNGHSAQFTLDGPGKQMVSGGPLNG